jgi:putative methyltransferase
LTHELLFGNGISGNFLQKKLILQHKTRLNAELVKLKIKRKVKKNEDLVPEQIKQAGH